MGPSPAKKSTAGKDVVKNSEWEELQDLETSPFGFQLIDSMEGNGKTPEIGEIDHSNEHGIIYVTTTNPNPVIYRYRVTTPDS